MLYEYYCYTQGNIHTLHYNTHHQSLPRQEANKKIDEIEIYLGAEKGRCKRVETTRNPDHSTNTNRSENLFTQLNFLLDEIIPFLGSNFAVVNEMTNI